jgi:hypothetical protein
MSLLQHTMNEPSKSLQRNSNWHQSLLVLQHLSILWSPQKWLYKDYICLRINKDRCKTEFLCILWWNIHTKFKYRDFVTCNHSPCFWQYPYIKASFLVLQYRQLEFYPETEYWNPHYFATSTTVTKLANASPHYTQTT